MQRSNVLRLSGLGQRQAPLTWGQLTQQAIYDFMGDESYRNSLPGSITLPGDTGLDRVREIVATLLTEHEALRTLYGRAADGSLRQNVLDRVEVELEVADAANDDEAGRVRDALWRRVFDHESETPIRFCLTRVRGGPTTLDFVTSHLACDALGARHLQSHVDNLLGGHPDQAARQPVDRTTVERSDFGRALSARNVDRWRRAMEGGLTRMPTPGLAALVPRFWAGSFQSPALGAALGTISERSAAKPSAVVLAALSAALSATFRLDPVSVRVAFHNRVVTPDDFGVDTLMQWGLACLAIDERPPAEQILTAGTEMMMAYATARYDIYDVLEVRERLRPDHGETLPQFFLNLTDLSEPAGADTTAGPHDRGHRRPRELMAESSFATHPSHTNDSPGLFFLATTILRDTVTINFLFDTCLLTPAGAERALRGVEDWVVSMAYASDG